MNSSLLLVASVFESKFDRFMFAVIALVSTVLMIFVGYRLLQMLQLTGYKLKAYRKWFKETKFAYISRLFMLSFLSFLSMILTNVLLEDFFQGKLHLFSYLSGVFCFALNKFKMKIEQNKR